MKICVFPGTFNPIHMAHLMMAQFAVKKEKSSTYEGEGFKLDISELEVYDKWFAYYNSDLYYPYAYKVWQYTDKGHVDGIAGEVDLNIAFVPLWQAGENEN